MLGLLGALALSYNEGHEVSHAPLISHIHHQLGKLEAHPQNYGSVRGGGTNRRSLASLTTENTNPIRFDINYDSLYELTAEPYTACFREGDWFRRGIPPTPVPTGVETCVRGVPEEAYEAVRGCWGRCRAADVITSAERDNLIAILNDVMQNDVQDLLRVVPVSGKLLFRHGLGSTARALVAKGWNPIARCNADCAVVSGAAVKAEYCTAGTDHDVVLSLTRPPKLHGVGGTGAHCATDNNERPIWLVFEWHTVLTKTWASMTAAEKKPLRGLVIHEVMHGLGFSGPTINYARDSAGNRKGLLEMKTVTDQDGDTDQVWHLTKGRGYEMAAKFFGCTDEAGTIPPYGSTQWNGLPLMGLPDSGRGSHWETRIMRDDVLAYGGTSSEHLTTRRARSAPPLAPTRTAPPHRTDRRFASGVADHSSCDGRPWLLPRQVRRCPSPRALSPPGHPSRTLDLDAPPPWVLQLRGRGLHALGLQTGMRLRQDAVRRWKARQLPSHRLRCELQRQHQMGQFARLIRR